MQCEGVTPSLLRTTYKGSMYLSLINLAKTFYRPNLIGELGTDILKKQPQTDIPGFNWNTPVVFCYDPSTAPREPFQR